jgi:hypothetical protein
MMSDGVDVTLKDLNPKEKALLIGAVYRQALIEVGHSADYHVYDLEQDLIDHKLSIAAGVFLQHVKAFYDSLPEMQQKVFLVECLEHGRHYAYWYLPYFSPKSFSHVCSSVYKKAETAF